MKSSESKDDSLKKFMLFLIVVIVVGYFLLFCCFWFVFGETTLDNLEPEAANERLKNVDVTLEFLDRFNAMVALLSAGIILMIVSISQIKYSDSWQWLSCGVIFLGIWALNNVVRSLVKDIGGFSLFFRENNTFYIFIQLFDHTFELLGAIILGIWLIKLYHQVYKRKDPHPGSLKTFPIIVFTGFMIHFSIFLLLSLTGAIQGVIDGGDLDFVLDKLENIIIGPLMFILGIFAFFIIFKMVEKNKAWILTGLGFISYGIDRTFMDLIRSFLEDKIIIPFLNITIGVSWMGLDPITRNTVPSNILYWFFEFGDHYWTSLTLFLVIGTGMLYQEYTMGFRIKPSYFLLLEDEIKKQKKPKSGMQVVPAGEGVPYTLESLLKARDILTRQVEERSQELLTEKKRIEAIIETIPNALLVLDFTGSLSLANRRFKNLYKEIFQKELNDDFNIFSQPDHVLFSDVKEILSSRIDTTIKWSKKIRTIEPLKGLYKEVRYANINIPDELRYGEVSIPGERLGIIIEYRDVTEFVEFDNLRKQFVSTVSHELRTPITAIDLSIKNLQEYSSQLTEELKEELMETIAQNSSVLNEMIADLLIISRVEAGTFELNPSNYSLKEVIDEVGNLLEPKRALKEHNIKKNINPDIKLLGDPRRINQVFRILYDNAIKYSEDKGTITISAIDHYKGKFNPKDNDGVLIQISDSGIGIRETDLPLLFERFFRTEESKEFQGTGLGLSIAKEILELHRGTIFVESEYGKGSTFTIFLPRLPIEEFKIKHKNRRNNP